MECGISIESCGIVHSAAELAMRNAESARSNAENFRKMQILLENFKDDCYLMAIMGVRLPEHPKRENVLKGILSKD